MSLAEGLAFGLGVAKANREKNYREELGAIQTPDQVAADRAQSAAQVAQQLGVSGGQQPQGTQPAPVNVQSAGISVPSAQAPGPTKKSPPITNDGTGGVASIASPASPTMNDQIDFMHKRAAVDLKYGKLDTAGVLNLENTVKNMKAEGLGNAIKLMNSGDVQGGAAAYNSMGNHRVQVVGSQDSVYNVGGVDVPTKLVTLRDDKGQTETINTAQYLNSMTGIENVIKQAQEGAKNANDKAGKDETARHNKKDEAETSRHNIASEENDRIKAEKTGSATASNDRQLINDGVKMLDTAYGIKRDPLTQAIDTNSIKDKAGYYADAAEIERRVNAGEKPMAVASEIADRAMRKQKMDEMPGTKSSGTPKKLW